MPDYGHDITFGTFITPGAGDPAQVVTLAQLSEDVGFDLVTFQDHPYNSGFLDTWTLMAYVAAATTRIHIAPNVLNLALRPPAVLARAAASLDLLSGGRFELGLGSGAFWDGIEAMGGGRLTAGEAVSALEEAMGIIRALWDTSTPSGVRLEGTRYQIRGAQAGTRARPRHRHLAGRLQAADAAHHGPTLADGWLPSLPYLKAGDLARGNATIDAAAVDAGRAPRDVRRLLNVSGRIASSASGLLQGPVSQWVEELSTLAIEDGIGTFIVMGDDPAVMERTRRGGRARRSGSRSPDARLEAASTPVAPVACPCPSRSSPRRHRRPRPERRPLGVTPTPDDGIRLSKLMRWDERDTTERATARPDHRPTPTRASSSRITSSRSMTTCGPSWSSCGTSSEQVKSGALERPGGA